MTQTNAPQDDDFLANLTEEVEKSMPDLLNPRRRIGRVISANGAQALVMVDRDFPFGSDKSPRIGSIICIEQQDVTTLGSIAGMTSPAPDIDSDGKDLLVLEVDILGTLNETSDGPDFSQGSSNLPYLGCIASMATQDDVAAIFESGEAPLLNLGELSQFPDVATRHRVDRLVYGNFAIIGAAQTGKSCAIVRIVREMIRKKTLMRTIIVDPHNEYGVSFGTMASKMNLSAGSFPHWVLSFAELTYLIHHMTGQLSADEVTLLEEAVIFARKKQAQTTFKKSALDTIFISVDTPVPYRLSDVVSYLDKSTHTDNDISGNIFRRLRTRLSIIARDRRYGAVFGGVSTNDSLGSFIGRLFSIPMNNKPVTLVQIDGAPKPLAQVITSVIARLGEEVSRWSHGEVPSLIVFEEADDYLCADNPLRENILRLMERGRKGNIGVALVSGRPRALCDEALQHCATIFATRLNTIADRQCVEEVVPENATGLLASAGMLGVAEVVASGQGVNIPLRMRFARIPAGAIPMEHIERAGGAPPPEGFTEAKDVGFLEKVVMRWRQQSFTADTHSDELPPTVA